jgi:hypothetical protein
MPRPPRATKVDLSAESPTPRADLRDVRVSFAVRLLGSRIHMLVVGASRASISHVVFMIGAMLPPSLALLICLAAHAGTAAVLLVCLPTMLLSGLFTWYVGRRR